MIQNHPVIALEEHYWHTDVVKKSGGDAGAHRGPDIVTRLNSEMDRILKNPEITGKLADLGFFTTGADTLPALAAYLRAQFDLWRRLTHDIGLQPE